MGRVSGPTAPRRRCRRRTRRPSSGAAWLAGRRGGTRRAGDVKVERLQTEHAAAACLHHTTLQQARPAAAVGPGRRGQRPHRWRAWEAQIAGPPCAAAPAPEAESTACLSLPSFDFKKPPPSDIAAPAAARKRRRRVGAGAGNADDGLGPPRWVVCGGGGPQAQLCAQGTRVRGRARRRGGWCAPRRGERVHAARAGGDVGGVRGGAAPVSRRGGGFSGPQQSFVRARTPGKEE
jgi:hypothetical protein